MLESSSQMFIKRGGDTSYYGKTIWYIINLITTKSSIYFILYYNRCFGKYHYIQNKNRCEHPLNCFLYSSIRSHKSMPDYPYHNYNFKCRCINVRINKNCDSIKEISHKFSSTYCIYCKHFLINLIIHSANKYITSLFLYFLGSSQF